MEKLKAPLYRFLKVLYFIAFGACLVLLVFFIKKNTYDEKIIDHHKTIISCFNGSKYSLADAGLSIKNSFEIPNGGGRLSAYLNNKEYGKRLRQLCSNDNSVDPASVSMNYSVDFKYGHNWNKIFIEIILGILVLGIIFEIIKRTFIYVVTGSFKIKK